MKNSVRRSLLILVAIVFVTAVMIPFAGAEQTALPKKKAKWTFIVFMNDANDLYPYGPLTMKQLKRIGSSDDANFVVLRGYFSKTRPSQKLLVKKDEVEVIETPGKVDMGDYKEMVKFVKWCHENFPADHYLLDIWNHGAGWKRHGLRHKGISYDDNSGNHITTAQLGESMKAIKAVIGHELDILAMDACLMQMAEVHHELSAGAKVVIAAEEIEPGTGWPYDLVAEAIVKNPGMTPAEYAKAIVSIHHQSYLKTKEDTTISAVDNMRFPAVFTKIQALASALLEKIGDTAVYEGFKASAAAVQIFDDGDNCDLAHLCQLINENIKDDKINTAAREVLDCLVASQQKIVLANGTTGKAETNAFGLSIYLPKKAFDTEYNRILKFGNSPWAKLIETYCARRDAENPPAPAVPAAAGAEQPVPAEVPAAEPVPATSNGN